MKRTAESILCDAEETLASAKMGLSMIKDPASRRAGIRNVIVFGRAFTNVLQNLRADYRARFDPWYAKYQAEMKADPLMAYFYALRSEILKEGTLRVSQNMTFSGNLGDLMRRYPKPRFAKGFFISDQNGGAGWEIEFLDGKKEKLYVALPPPEPGLAVSSMLHLPDAPEPLRHVDIAVLADRYLSYFDNILADARATFVGTSA